MKFKFIKKNKNNKLPKNVSIGKNTIISNIARFRYDLGTNNIIQIGNDSYLNCNFIFESEKGEITIGDRTFINGGTDLISREKIEIGNDVTIAWGCTIYDHNSHSIDWKERRKDLFQEIENYKNNKNLVYKKNWNVVKSRPIKICDKAWLGFGVTVLNGVTIGEGAIVGANSVVREDVEPWTIVAGNPAIKIKDIRKDDINE